MTRLNVCHVGVDATAARRLLAAPVGVRQVRERRGEGFVRTYTGIDPHTRMRVLIC